MDPRLRGDDVRGNNEAVTSLQCQHPNRAKSLGAEGVVVKDLGAVGEALDKAVDAQKRGKTTVLEMLVTKELGDPFRRDALKKPKRLLKKYEHTSVA